MNQSYRSLIDGQVSELIRSIRLYSSSQKDLWVKVPFLALGADGRTGFSDDYAHAYTHGLWRLDMHDEGFYTIGVDLKNGNLVDPLSVSQGPPFDMANIPGKKFARTRWRDARNPYVLRLGLDIGMIDASKVINDLESKIATPVPDYARKGYDAFRNDEYPKLLRSLKRKGFPVD